MSEYETADEGIEGGRTVEGEKADVEKQGEEHGCSPRRGWLAAVPARVMDEARDKENSPSAEMIGGKADAQAQTSPERRVDRTALSLPFSCADHISAQHESNHCHWTSRRARAAALAEGREQAARWPGAR
jgi:hypothetical protein